jgi:hypothetical protein
MGIRQRDTTYKRKFPPCYYATGPKTGQVAVPGYESVIPGGQITDSSDNPGWPPEKGAYGDFGGPFRTVRRTISQPATSYSSDKSRNGNEIKYSGPIVTPLLGLSNLGKLALPSGVNSSLDKAGATAISRVAPTNPHAQFSTALGELVKDGIPSLPGIRTWRERSLSAKNAGDEFLNAQFGWKPLVSDVTEVSSSIANSHKYLTQYERDGSKHVRRRYDYPVELLTENSSTSSAQSAEGPSNFNNLSFPGTITTTYKVERRRWFSGSFVYATPSSSTSWKKVADAGSSADHLLGTSLTPNVLWELTPWSWAVDWFSNAGDVINNVTQFGQAGLVMRYGYMMEEIIQSVTCTLDRAGLYLAENRAVPPSSATQVTKQRVPANPYGFGIGWEGLSPTQLAITAALGITRLR